MTISFTLPIVPPTATSQGAGKRMVIRNGKPMFFKDKRAVAAESTLTALCLPHKPEKPLEGPLRLSVHYFFPFRKSEPKATIERGWDYHTTRPDLSNLIKMLEDVMTRCGFCLDDAQICDLSVSKRRGPKPAIAISITQLETEKQ